MNEMTITTYLENANNDEATLSMIEITPHKYATSITGNEIVRIESIQDQGKEITLMFFDVDSGVAVASQYVLTNEIRHGIPQYQFQGQFFAFTLSCFHEFKEIEWDETAGFGHYLHCDHMRRCTKCGKIMIYNSGD